jgi:hypothetical protein
MNEKDLIASWGPTIKTASSAPVTRIRKVIFEELKKIKKTVQTGLPKGSVVEDPDFEDGILTVEVEVKGGDGIDQNAVKRLVGNLVGGNPSKVTPFKDLASKGNIRIQCEWK